MRTDAYRHPWRRTMHAALGATVCALMLAGAQAAGGGGPGAGPGAGPGPGAGSGPGSGPRTGPGAGPGAGQGAGPGAGPASRPGPRYGADVTPGWALMNEAERNLHRERIQAVKTRQECLALMATHREQMAERARAQGKTLATPRGDPCGGLN